MVDEQPFDLGESGLMVLVPFVRVGGGGEVARLDGGVDDGLLAVEMAAAERQKAAHRRDGRAGLGVVGEVGRSDPLQQPAVAEAKPLVDGVVHVVAAGDGPVAALHVDLLLRAGIRPAGATDTRLRSWEKSTIFGRIIFRMRIMDRLRAMTVFVRVAERGSFAGASADLGLSHGTASAVVKEIEAALGVELIRRTTRRMALTDAGLEYLSRARRILDEVEELDESVSERGRVAGRLTVQAPVAFSRLVLAPSLGGLMARHPALRLSVISRDRLPDMIAESIDCLIYVGPLPDSALVARSLGRFPLIAAAAPDYLARRGAPEAPDDLEAHDLIDVTSATSGRPLPWRFRIAGRTVLRPAASARLAFESSEAAVAAAIAGAGIVQNISYVLRGPIEAGLLVPVLGAWRDPGSEMHLVTRRYLTVPARVKLFGAHVRSLAADELGKLPPA
jgi:LysR family transcriptional regulator for bpeEF and oprC